MRIGSFMKGSLVGAGAMGLVLLAPWGFDRADGTAEARSATPVFKGKRGRTSNARANEARFVTPRKKVDRSRSLSTKDKLSALARAGVRRTGKSLTTFSLDTKSMGDKKKGVTAILSTKAPTGPYGMSITDMSHRAAITLRDLPVGQTILVDCKIEMAKNDSQQVEIYEYYSPTPANMQHTGNVKKISMTTAGSSWTHLTFVTVAGQAGSYQYAIGPPIGPNLPKPLWSLRGCDVTVVGK